MSSFKDVNASGNIDYNTMTKNGDTYPKIVWEHPSTGWYMTGDHSVPINLDEYPTGIILVWTRYSQDTSTAQNYGYNFYTFIKNANDGSGGICVPLFSQTGTANGLKYVYIKQNEVLGHSQNNQQLNTNIGNIDNRNWVLRRVVAF